MRERQNSLEHVTKDWALLLFSNCSLNCFLKDPETFRARKALAKPRTLRLQSCFIHIFLLRTKLLFIQDVSGTYTSAFLDTNELKMALRARTVSGAFERGSITYLALPGLNDLGRYAVPISPLMDHFFLPIFYIYRKSQENFYLFAKCAIEFCSF